MENYQNIDFRVAFFDMSHSPCVIFNKNMILLDINNKALQILNIKREEVLGDKLIDVFPYIESTEPLRAYLEVIRTGIPIEDEIKLKIKSEDYYFFAKAFKVGEGLGLAGMDITAHVATINELKQTQFQLKTANKDLHNINEELEELSYLSAHNLKAH